MKLFVVIILICITLASIEFVNVYGQYGQSNYEGLTLYQNSNSNNQISLSLDKGKYLEGESVNIIGTVVNYKEGQKVNLGVVDSVGHLLSKFDVIATSNGYVLSFQTNGFTAGDYWTWAQYGNTGEKIFVHFFVQKKDIGLITIQKGASTNQNSQFDPQEITIEQGQTTSWTNNDDTIHSIQSVTSQTSNTPTSAIESGIIAPGKQFTVTLPVGDYYYDDFYSPWLRGIIHVVASQNPYQNLIQSHTILLLSTTNSTSSWKSTCDGCHEKINVTAEHSIGSSSIQWSTQGNISASSSPVYLTYNFIKSKVESSSYLITWLKTSGSVEAPFYVKLRDSQGNELVLTNFTLNSFPKLAYLQLPLSKFISRDPNFDSSSISTFSIYLPNGNSLAAKKAEILVNYLELSDASQVVNVQNNSSQQPLLIQSKNDSYVHSENMTFYGQVSRVEREQSVTIRIFNPIHNLIFVNQLKPGENGSFNFTVPAKGNNFDMNGLYTVSSQYGIKEYTAQTSFMLTDPQLIVSNYHSFDIYLLGQTYYAIPTSFLSGYLDLHRLWENDYSDIYKSSSEDDIKKIIDTNPMNPVHLRWNFNGTGFSVYMYSGLLYAVLDSPENPSGKKLENHVLIPTFNANDMTSLYLQIQNYSLAQSEKVAKPKFPVPDDVLTEIWKERTDLQKTFPEVANGNLTNLQDWAVNKGWNEDPRLSILIPPGKTPSYLQPVPQQNATNATINSSSQKQTYDTVLIPIIIAVGMIIIVGTRGYKYLRSKKISKKNI